jgi:methionine-gamma-lyase
MKPSDASAAVATDDQFGFTTRTIHAGYDSAAHHGGLNPPVHLSAAFVFESAEHGGMLFAGEQQGMIYSRVTNPTVQILEQRLASLEGGEAALACASGMGAICALMWTLLRPGDEVLVDATLYGCTHSLLHHFLAEFGVVITVADLTAIETLPGKLTDRTALVLFETPANPNMRLIDIEAVARLSRQHSRALVVVNTYCTPYLQRPLALGADVVVHSVTKYLNGHGDVIAGALVGTADLIAKMRFTGIQKLTGACLSPMDAYLVLRGLKTLTLRMDRHCQNAQYLADFLSGHPRVAAVHYPGLASHPQYRLAQRQMAQPGAMIGLELHGGVQAGKRFIDALRLITRAVSLGDAETLAQHPASMTHATYKPEERERHLISDGLVRLSVGLEDVADIRADLENALASIG